jgi:GNAT superfamily N-acetyltransferase
MSQTTITSYTIRPPSRLELPAITPWFASSSLGLSQCMLQAAFGQPGDVPLGAYIARASNDGRVGQFTLFVRPECRRRGIGRSLLKHLCQLALAGNAQQLILSELVPADHPDNAFYRSAGLSVDTKLESYELDIAKHVVPTCQRIVERFRRSHPHLRDVRVTSLAELDPRRVAQFLTSHYGGFVDEQTQRLASGFFDPSLTTVSIRADGSITAIAFFLSRPDETVILLDLVLTDPAIRNGPTPLVLFDETARRALAAGKTTVAFEADARRDTFALGFAARCGVTTPTRCRFRYSIDRAGMQAIR